MKSLIIPTLAGASFSTFLVCGMVAASSFRPSYAPHKFENLQAGIWTSGVVRIDRSEQTFERVAAIAPPPAANQAFTVRDPINDHSVEATGGSAMQTASASTPAITSFAGSGTNPIEQTIIPTSRSTVVHAANVRRDRQQSPDRASLQTQWQTMLYRVIKHGANRTIVLTIRATTPISRSAGGNVDHVLPQPPTEQVARQEP
jgi:hypothetical protein